MLYKHLSVFVYVLYEHVCVYCMNIQVNGWVVVCIHRFTYIKVARVNFCLA